MLLQKAKLVSTLLLFLLSFSVSSYAYSIENEPNLNRTYTWKWNDGVESVQSFFLSGNPTGTAPSRNMHIRAGMTGYGSGVTQNGGVNYTSLSAYDVVSVDSSSQNPIIIYASQGIPLAPYEYPYVILNVSTGRDDYLLISHDFTFVVDFITIGFEPNNTPSGYMPEVSSLCKLKLALSGEDKYVLNASYQSVEQLTNSRDEKLYRYTCFFVMDNTDGDNIEFDQINVTFPCAVQLGSGIQNADNTWSQQYYSRYRVSISDPKLYETADPNSLAVYTGVSAANNQMLQELGTINTVDESRLQGYDISNILTDGVIDIFQARERDIFDSFQDLKLDTNDYIQNLSSESNSLWEIFFGTDETQLTLFNIFLRDCCLISILLIGTSVLLFSLGGLSISISNKFRGD